MDASDLLHVMTEPTKNALLRQLQQEERTVSDLVAATGREQSNVSHNLRVLRDAGLVKARREGRNQRYRLSDPELGNLLDTIHQMAGQMERIAYLAGLDLPMDPAFHGYG